MEKQKNIRGYGSQQFVIKARPSQNLINSQNEDPNLPISVEHQVDLFLQRMVRKSKRFHELLQQKGIEKTQDFCDRKLFTSVCLKTILKTILQKMNLQRRLGRHLRGLNMDNLVEVENQIWNCLLRQIQLYKNEQDYFKGTQDLRGTLAQRREEILAQLNQVRSRVASIKE